MTTDDTQTSFGDQDAKPSAQDIPHVTEKDRKADIMAAYEELKHKYETKAQKAKSKEHDFAAARESTIVKKAKAHTVDHIVDSSARLEQDIHRSLADINTKLQERIRTLEELEEAISIEEKRLKDVHDISAAANTLTDLIETHRLKKWELDEEMARIKEEWKREREEERYHRTQEQQREQDAFDQKQREREQELDEQRETLKQEKQDLATIAKRAESFDAELAKAVDQSRSETEKRIRTEEEGKAALLSEQAQREKAIADLRITGLTTTVSELQKECTLLKKQLSDANREAKDIAIKVIEGASHSVASHQAQRFSARPPTVTKGEE
jgi:DNA repair exonuclease SbcCD ATPase subunit